jgi:hypothetical protein
MVIFAIILLAVQSAVRVAGSAIPDGRSGPSAAALGTAALDVLNQDLTYATAISPSRMSARDLELTVPDRNGDGNSETIRYQWSGAGAPLTRQVNGGAVVTLAADVREFSLVLFKKATPNPSTTSESPEVVLSSYDPQVTLTNQRINNSTYRGEYFVPSLPANATAWRVTRAMLKVGVWGANKGLTQIRLRPAPGGLPGPTVLDEATLDESTLASAYAWTSFAYTKAAGLKPGDGLCLTLEWVSDSDSCGVNCVINTGAAPAANLVSSSDGVTWTAVTTDDLVHYVYGTYSTPDPVTYTYSVSSARCAIRVGADPAARSETSARVINQPMVAGP